MYLYPFFFSYTIILCLCVWWIAERHVVDARAITAFLKHLKDENPTRNGHVDVLDPDEKVNDCASEFMFMDKETEDTDNIIHGNDDDHLDVDLTTPFLQPELTRQDQNKNSSGNIKEEQSENNEDDSNTILLNSYNKQREMSTYEEPPSMELLKILFPTSLKDPMVTVTENYQEDSDDTMIDNHALRNDIFGDLSRSEDQPSDMDQQQTERVHFQPIQYGNTRGDENKDLSWDKLFLGLGSNNPKVEGPLAPYADEPFQAYPSIPYTDQEDTTTTTTTTASEEEDRENDRSSNVSALSGRLNIVFIGILVLTASGFILFSLFRYYHQRRLYSRLQEQRSRFSPHDYGIVNTNKNYEP
jgi:hypothetical protein